MVMRKMRENMKSIMLILTVAFVAWLVLDWVQSRNQSTQAGANPIVGVVNGQDIRYVQWSRYLQSELEQARQGASQPLTDEETYRVTEQAWNQMVNQVLIQQELDRLGIGVTDAEIKQAFKTSPPPALRNHPAFQTDGHFDYQKYRDFFSRPGVDVNLLQQIEQYYRTVLPQSKLVQLVSQEVDVSDADLWAAYQDQNETARVRFVTLDPASTIPDSAVTVSDQEIQGYYDAHRADFERPATATVDLVTLSQQPSAQDTATARHTADSLRTLVESGKEKFTDLVQKLSADSASGVQASNLGWVHRGDLVSAVDSVAFRLRGGAVSRPVLSGSSFHLVHVNARSGDSLSLDHILVPIQLSAEHQDRIFDQMDELENLALDQGLVAAADSMGLTVRKAVQVAEGSQFVPGAGALGVAIQWAFDPGTTPGTVSQFYQNGVGYHLLQLESRSDSSVAPLSAVRDQIRDRLVQKAKTDALRRRLDEAAQQARSDGGLGKVAAAHGWKVQESSTFSRQDFVPGLGRATQAVGAAFGLPVGSVSDAVDAGGRLALVEVVKRTPADRKQFLQIEGQLRAQMLTQRRQSYVQQWLQALRDHADIQDLRQQLSVSRSPST
jgi:parvulin-like peptidyl-prolyl isomerase